METTDSPLCSRRKVAVEGFKHVLEDALVPDVVNVPLVPSSQGQRGPVVEAGRSQFWKDVADVYEKFLMGACGAADCVPAGQSIAPEAVKADRVLEVSGVDLLCEKALKSCQDAPSEVDSVPRVQVFHPEVCVVFASTSWLIVNLSFY